MPPPLEFEQVPPTENNDPTYLPKKYFETTKETATTTTAAATTTKNELIDRDNNKPQTNKENPQLDYANPKPDEDLINNEPNSAVKPSTLRDPTIHTDLNGTLTTAPGVAIAGMNAFSSWNFIIIIISVILLIILVISVLAIACICTRKRSIGIEK